MTSKHLPLDVWHLVIWQTSYLGFNFAYKGLPKKENLIRSSSYKISIHQMSEERESRVCSSEGGNWDKG